MADQDNPITDFIAASIEEKPVAASQAFSAAMDTKLSSKIDDFEEDIRSRMFDEAKKADLIYSVEVKAQHLPGTTKKIKKQTVDVPAKNTSDAIKKAERYLGVDEDMVGKGVLEVGKIVFNKDKGNK